MKLRRIKLSGFKSFVDSTSIDLPGQLIGIVGPNGCGKSNVVDALRWVLGESSARQLRGESMQDVIFNGSQNRAPVSKAQVDLRFENLEGRLIGPFAAYTDIAVRRELGRDGVSHYLINQTRCRRRDVNDLFLGTGLGPRAYAIIEQGMISRLIEARPEDLRAFLEEASGVSRYKERRRETSQRMAQTRENLTRVEDLRQELAAQMKRLERQADAARRYRAMKAEERRWQVARIRHRLEDLDGQMQAGRDEAHALNGQMEARRAALHAAELDGLHLAEQLRTAQAQLNETQTRYYAGAADLARLEQELRHLRQEEQRIMQELNALASETAAQASQLDLERSLREAEQRLQMLSHATQTLRDEESSARGGLKQAEQDLETAEKRLQALDQELGNHKREAQVQTARLEQLRLRLQELGKRQARLLEEARPFSHEADMTDLQNRMAVLAGEFEATKREDEAREAARCTQREEIARHEHAFDLARERYHVLKAQRQSLQQTVDGISQPGEGLQRLARQLAEEVPSVLALLEVMPGWEQAVEAALTWRIKAWFVRNLDVSLPAGWLENQKNGQFALVEPCPGTVEKRIVPEDALIHRVTWREAAANPLQGWLTGLRCANSLEEALRRRHELREDERWVTVAGAFVGPCTLEWDRGQARDSLLEKRSTLAAMVEEEHSALELLEKLQGLRDKSRREFERLERALQDMNKVQQGRQQALSRLQAQYARWEAESLAHRKRAAQIQEELQGLRSDMAGLDEDLARSGQAVRIAEGRMRTLDSQRLPVHEERQRLKEQSQSQRMLFSRLRENMHQIALQQKGLETECQGKRAAQVQFRLQLEQTRMRGETLQALLDTVRHACSPAENAIQACLRARDSLELQLRDARNALAILETTQRDRDEQRLKANHDIDRLRQLLQEMELRLSVNAAKAEELQAQLDQLVPSLEEDREEVSGFPVSDLAAIEDHLQQLARRLGALGNVNLAAIEEFQHVVERKTYLDVQCADLTSALDTLDAAIRRMDKETRDRFKQTFDAVNRNFQTLFPRLFGGGQAQLTLTEDNLLEAGVNVVARPPGKRNSSIHLLSGGEKALTAVALVFAMFQINPAPFCVLDEVDAPLDEANVGRFCDMVREMSKDTQFVFITHNKVTMQLADHLIGVTMAEPGASRIVSVNVAEALRMAGAA